MKKGLYLRLALDGMRKNKRLYLPYLLTCAGMVMMFYILYSLAYSPVVRDMRGGDTMAVVLLLGTIVIAVFALLFLLYTNSFLARRRNREFGLYNILGMNKRNLSRILSWETLLSALISILGGLAGGLLFAKLAELFLLRMAGERAGFALSVAPRSIAAAFLFFGAIFALLLLVSLARVGILRPLDLLKSEAAGEKPPKANWVLALAGLALLGVAYYLAVTIESPLTALFIFFAAVLMVILATYLLFIAGSVTLCRLLQKNKKYYYKSAHFVSVSSMAFRMKRNGAGLASICILATMVLVMLSSTSCLFFGGEDAIRGMAPYDVTVALRFAGPENCSEAPLRELTELAAAVSGGREKDAFTVTNMNFGGYFENGTLDMDGYSRFLEISSSPAILEHLRSVYFLPLRDLDRLTGESHALEPGQALVWSSGDAYKYDSFAVKGCSPIRVAGVLRELPYRLTTEETLTVTYCFFLPDWEARAGELQAYCEALEDDMVLPETAQQCFFDLPGLEDEEQLQIVGELRQALLDRMDDDDRAWTGFTTNARAEIHSSFFSMNGSLFFLGIILSIVFIAAAALIIYYKQLSEGYEDQRRFGIMQKVGMTGKEIKSAVNSQVLTVFFAPLLMSGLHLSFAFPFVHKLIRLFGVTNTPLLILTSVLCFLAFGLFYVFVYRRTARVYYNIVSEGEELR
jgi:ABC-type antimicrobial peptide transport system, permease component